MNYGTSQSVDFSMPSLLRGFVDDGGLTVRLTLKCFDYGGRTELTATSGPSTATLEIPADADDNWFPDGGWNTQFTHIADSGLIANQDDDNTCPDLSNVSPQQPPLAQGLIGDGLTNFEEYRGFVIMGTHRRTLPLCKDLFISSDLSTGIWHAFALPTVTWQVNSNGTEYNTARVINFNYTNTGLGGQIPGHFDQRALKVLKKMLHPSNDPNIYGYIWPVTGGTQCQLSPNEVDRIEVYEDALVATGWTGSNLDELRKIVTGHEVGHGVHIFHRPDDSGCNDGTIVGDFDSIMQRLPSIGIPTSYNNYDMGQIRLHLRF
jgi:hypothetical protein